MSKLGLCSRSQAWQFIKAGRVKVNGTVRSDPEWPVLLGSDQIDFDQERIRAREKVYLMLNKPRGLVTTASDEKGRPTVFRCLVGEEFPHLTPVGRLDKASEGLLLFTNDNDWAAQLTAPGSRVEKVYHVQIDRLAHPLLLERMIQGVHCDEDLLRAARASVLRLGNKNSWVEVALDEGKNRHIRRLLDALDTSVLRLIRVAVGPLKLGNLPKGEFRRLTMDEVAALQKA